MHDYAAEKRDRHLTTGNMFLDPGEDGDTLTEFPDRRFLDLRVDRRARGFLPYLAGGLIVAALVLFI